MAIDECLNHFTKVKPHYNALYLAVFLPLTCVVLLTSAYLIEKLPKDYLQILISLPLLMLLVVSFLVCFTNAFFLANKTLCHRTNIESIDTTGVRAWQFEAEPDGIELQ